jgi:hypothetical protein
LVFTELILQILYWIEEIAFHSGAFLLDVPTFNRFVKSISFLFGGALGCFLFLDVFGGFS